MSLTRSIRVGMYGAMQVAGKVDPLTSAQTTMTISGLNLAADGEYRIRLSLKNATAGSVSVRMFNGTDTTTTNYGVSSDYANSGTPSAVRANVAEIGTMQANACTNIDIFISLDVEGKPRAFSRVGSGVRAALNFFDYAWIHDVVGNVTAITFSASVASAFAIGSHAVAYKVGVTSNPIGSQIGFEYDESFASPSGVNPVNFDDTPWLIAEGDDSGLLVPYTPKSASSWLEIEAVVPFCSHSGTGTVGFGLFDGGASAIWTGFASTPLGTGYLQAPPRIRRIIPAGSVTLRNYTLRFGTPSGTAYLNSNPTQYFSDSNFMSLSVREIQR